MNEIIVCVNFRNCREENNINVQLVLSGVALVVFFHLFYHQAGKNCVSGQLIR